MTLSEIAVLGALSLIIGRWIPAQYRLTAILVLTIAVLCGLQGSLFFALLSILLVVATWAIVRQENTIPWLALLLGGAIGVLLIRPASLLPIPTLLGAVIVGGIGAGSLTRLSHFGAEMRQRLAGLLILLIIAVLILLKTPDLVAFGTDFAAGRFQSPIDWEWLGISYLSFRLIALLLDFRQGRLTGGNFQSFTLQDLLIFALFPPALAAGPIDRAQRFIPDLHSMARLDTARFLLGGQRVASGLFRKFVLANTLALVALSPQLAEDTRSLLGAWALVYLYAAYIFLDFSGYTDIAIGLGIWLGVKLPENFNRPYLQPTLPLFWQNWHMTLTSWFRSYVFMPFSRALLRRKLPISEILFSQVLTMSLIAFWHGVTLHFFLWGLWHALGIYAHHLWTKVTRRWFLRLREQRPRLHQAWQGFSILLTFHFVAVGWVFFALPQPFEFLRKLVGA